MSLFLNFYHTMSLFLNFYHTMSLFLMPCLCFSTSIMPCLCFSTSIMPCLCFSTSIMPCLCFSTSIMPCLCFSTSIMPCLCFSTSIMPCLCFSTSIMPCLCFSTSIMPCLCFSTSIMPLCISTSIIPCLCFSTFSTFYHAMSLFLLLSSTMSLFLNFSTSIMPSLFLNFYHTMSLFLNFYHAMSLFLNFYHTMSLFLNFYHAMSLFLNFYHAMSLFLNFYHAMSLFLNFYHAMFCFSTSIMPCLCFSTSIMPCLFIAPYASCIINSMTNYLTLSETSIIALLPPLAQIAPYASCIINSMTNSHFNETCIIALLPPLAQIAPYASCIVNCIYWAVGSPRLITIPEAKVLLQPHDSPWLPSSPGCPKLPHRLLSICDISADPGGSIEFMKECTNIDKPFSLYDAEQNVDKESFAGDGVLICSIDNMPAQIPREATEYFGSLLFPYIEEMLKSNAKVPFEDYECSPVVKNAVIASNGKLTPNFEYIRDLRLRSQSAQKAKRRESGERVLILGAGYVSGPVVEYLARESKTGITVASQFQEELDNTCRVSPSVDTVLMDLGANFDELENVIKDCDLVISLLPYTFHPEIARFCIKYHKNMVTASYISPDMRELHKAAKDAGITIMNEIGVDPGIDHMLAMQCFDEVHRAGGKVTSYVCYCGGIPAPENSGTPLRYKFSWFPKGVLMNVMSAARYLKDGKVVEIPGKGGLLDAVEDLTFLPGLNLEGFPNRDSTIYGKEYGIESARTILRGTIRYKGFTEGVRGLIALGLFETDQHSQLHPSGPVITWKEFMCSKFNRSGDILEDTLKDLILEKLGGDQFRLESIVGLGLINNDPIDKRGSPIDTLSNYLAKRLAYGTNERDMVLMRHDVEIVWGDGRKEQRSIDMINYGDLGGFSAMAKTVGLPTAIAARMILNVCAPLAMETYQPILQRLKKEGIYATELNELPVSMFSALTEIDCCLRCLSAVFIS
ncbi:unnamed protein product [Candidula unifasciata]|uniref:Uncharacterized protein n=1 Tax=Candidula unifasciata TaxID=100452 RepID=A0A8S3ZXG7_9EUPU|nr:unnamed protein product [Candidula unifasciata]